MNKTNYANAFSNWTGKFSLESNAPNIIGRDEIINLMAITLLRFNKPNILLVGKAGVGKTAIVEELAYRIANREIEDALQKYELFSVDTNALIAGNSYRGKFEEAAQEAIDASTHNGRTIWFIDEFHTIMNLGRMGDGQTPGFHNTIKPHLTDGKLRIIGATTYEEMHLIEADPAILRRFYIINVPEPNEEAVKRIIQIKLTKYTMANQALGLSKVEVNAECYNVIYDKARNLNGSNPDKTIDFIDFMVSRSRLKGIQEINAKVVAETHELYVKNSKSTVKP